MTVSDVFEQLVAQNLGKPVEKEDPTNVDQCMDWIFAYVDALGIPRSTVRHLLAYQVWTQATNETRQYFDLIPNTTTFVPKKGDIGVFGTGVGTAGHVCLTDGNGDTKTFQSADQNWNGHKYIEYIWHNYNSFLGVLRPKQVYSQQSTQGGGATVANMYKGQDISNPEAMKVCVDVWVRYMIDKTIVDKSTLDALQKQFDDYKKSVPQVDPKAQQVFEHIQQIAKLVQ